jgi:hypothetical protein
LDSLGRELRASLFNNLEGDQDGEEKSEKRRKEKEEEESIKEEEEISKESW